jgi:osmotically-inducible protein OsmY
MRTVVRLLVIVAVLSFGAFLILGYWPGTANDRPAVGTSGSVDTERARERGAEIGEKAAIATEKVKETAQEATITAKIKAKMALDDSVKSRAIDVTTEGSTVTLSGTVRSASEHARAVALARETSGVSKVVDRLTVGE